MDKVIFIVCDGLGDRPIPELNDQTPLEAAKTPNLDYLTSEGITGVMNTIDIGIRPGSDTAHLALFGYDPNVYYTGRGPFEVAGIDMNLKPGDICFRANMGTIDDKLKVIDRRAGRIDDTSEFAKLFNNTVIDGIKFILKKGTGHRVGIIMRGKGLSANITDCDPHVINEKLHECKAKDDTTEAKFTASVLNKFIALTTPKLKNLETNKKRVAEGKFPANIFLMRGAGVYPKIPSFKNKYGLKAVCIAGAGLYKGVGKIFGMDTPEIKGATGKPNSNLLLKTEKVIELFNKYDFFFVHFKGADTLGEDGDYEGKKKFIEKIDTALKPILNLKDTLIVVTADHSTPCHLKQHSADDVPVLISGKHVRKDEIKRFNERECYKGRLGHIKGLNLMPIVIDLMGLAELFGA